MGVIGFVGWYRYREVERAADKFLEREDRVRDSATAQVAEAHRAQIAVKDETISRLDTAMNGELRGPT